MPLESTRQVVRRTITSTVVTIQNAIDTSARVVIEIIGAQLESESGPTQ